MLFICVFCAHTRCVCVCVCGKVCTVIFDEKKNLWALLSYLAQTLEGCVFPCPYRLLSERKGKRAKLFSKFNITWRKRCLWKRCEVNTNFMHVQYQIAFLLFWPHFVADTTFLPLLPYPSRVICITLYVQINISSKHLFWRDGSDTHVHTPPSSYQCYQSSLDVHTVLCCFIIWIQ